MDQARSGFYRNSYGPRDTSVQNQEPRLILNSIPAFTFKVFRPSVLWLLCESRNHSCRFQQADGYRGAGLTVLLDLVAPCVS